MMSRECIYCGETVLQDINVDGNERLSIHRECWTRMIVGSVGHQSGRCPCYGGSYEDPPGMTKREAAQAAELHSLAREHIASSSINSEDFQFLDARRLFTFAPEPDEPLEKVETWRDRKPLL
jgi:hypothetical protein